MKRSHREARAVLARAAVRGLLAAAIGASCANAVSAQSVVPVRVIDGGIPAPLIEVPGDAVRGRRVVIDPARGNCLICHTLPDAPGERFQGDIGPPLAGVGTRLTPARLRLRIVDGTVLNPETVMPAYHRVHGLHRVAREWRGRPVLSALEVEDVVAYLLTLDAGP